MPWPMSQDYNEAVQDPQTSFADAELRGGHAATNALGLPMPRSGNFADVYEVTGASGAKWAVKCFTREVPGLQERYHQINLHLLKAKLPFTVEFQYQQGGIRIRGQWFPILKMQWVDGLLLNEFIRQNLDKPKILEGLGDIWVRMARRLREAGIAHADLQHGNVILVPGSKATSLAVKLIDYDGMFVPALANKPSGEVGHPNFQHPERLKKGTYNADVDRLPLLAVACALRGLVVGGKALWDKYDNGDNLLFREADLANPEKSPLLRELWNQPDETLHDLVGYLVLGLTNSLDQVPPLDEVFRESRTLPITATLSNRVQGVLGAGANIARTAVMARPSALLVAPVIAAVPPAAAPAPIVLPAPSAWDNLESPEPIHGAQRRQPQRSNKGLLYLVGGALSLIVVLGAVLIFLLNDGKKAPDEQKVAQVDPGKTKQGSQPTDKDIQKNRDKKGPEKTDPDKTAPDDKNKDKKQKPEPKEPRPVRPAGVAGKQTIDLIPLIDPPRHTIHGKWSVTGNTLSCNEGNFVPRIEIPYKPPEEYDFTVVFSQPALRNGISLIMPNPNGGSFFWHLGSQDGSAYGFHAKPDQRGQVPGLIAVNTAYTTTVEVRKNGVRGLVNGKVLIDHPTDFRDVTCDSWRTIKDTTRLAVACDDPTVFHFVQVTEISGTGKQPPVSVAKLAGKYKLTTAGPATESADWFLTKFGEVMVAGNPRGKWTAAEDGAVALKLTLANYKEAVLKAVALDRLVGLGIQTAGQASEWTLKRQRVLPPPEDTGTGKLVYISDFKETTGPEAERWFRSKGKMPSAAGGDVPIEIDGLPQPHAIYMHPEQGGYVWARYFFNPGPEFFLADVIVPQGVAPNQENPGSAIQFEVVGEGKSLWKSQPISVSGISERVKVPIKGVRIFELRVHCQGKNDFAWAVWIEPRLVVPGKRAAKSPKSEVTEMEGAATIAGKYRLSFTGKSPGSTDWFLTKFGEAMAGGRPGGAWTLKDGKIVITTPKNQFHTEVILEQKDDDTLIGQAMQIDGKTAEWTMKRQRVLQPAEAVEGGKTVFVSQLKASLSKLIRFGYRHNGTMLDSAGKEWPIELDGKTAPHSIFMLPPEKDYGVIGFDLPKDYAFFLADTLIPQGVMPGQLNPYSRLTFEVVGDGVSLWKSKEHHQSGQTDRVKVGIKGVKKLELRVHCPQGNRYCWAVWVEPRLITASLQNVP